MINVYSANNTNFSMNGNATLQPIRCDLNITINGAWSLEIEVPYDEDEKWKYLVEGAIITVDVGCVRELSSLKQRFRIYDYKKGISSLKAIAFPVAMESTHDAPIDNLIISNKTGAQAMAQLQGVTSKYTLYSNISNTGSTALSNTNVNSAIASGEDDCFISIWGGEICYDNLKFSVLNRLGENQAEKHPVIYGRNMTDVSYEKDDSGLITRLRPISTDGIRLNGTGYVDSPKISEYPVVHNRYMQVPYKLVIDDISDSSQTAQLTASIKSQITTLVNSLSHTVYNSAVSNKYEIEYIKKLRNDIVEAVQNMATANIYHADMNKVMKDAIKSGMEWLKDVSKPEWVWHEGSNDSWWYGASTSSRAVSEWVYVDRIWRYFGSDAYWQRPKDDGSGQWDWIQESSGKRYGNNQKYFAHDEYVYITRSGVMYEYWFNDDGWYEDDESGESDYAWHGSGTSADPWWFGDDSTTGKYLKSCWAFIDGTYYYFDDYGYYDGTTKFDNYRWDWVDGGSANRTWFGNGEDKNYARVYVTDQWLKVDGDWYRFDSNGYAIGASALENETKALFTIGMAQVKTLCESLNSQAYTLLYSLMRSYCDRQFASGIDVPVVTITVNMVDLSHTTEYEDYENLEKVCLGDNVKCIDYEHGIATYERVVGLTYDCISKTNSKVVIGVADSTVADKLGVNANGSSVAGGFDTSAIESALTSHGNSIASLQANKQDKLTAGENITIIGNVISSTGGGKATIYSGKSAPSDDLGANNDLYLRTDTDDIDLVGDVIDVDGGMVSYTKTRIAYNEYDFNQVIYGNSNWDHVTYELDSLNDGETYTVSFTHKFTNATFYWNYTNKIYVSVDGSTGGEVELEADNNEHEYSFTFTAGGRNSLTFSYPKVEDSRTTNSDISGLTIKGDSGIKEIYGKINGHWERYEGSGGGTSYGDFIGATSSADGAHGLVPQPFIADRNKFLKGDGTWGQESVFNGTSNGLVPTPNGLTTSDYSLRADGTWVSDYTDFYLENGLIGSAGGSYITCPLDKNMTEGDYKFTMRDGSTTIERLFTWEGSTITLDINGDYTMQITETSAQLTWWRGSWRNIYGDIIKRNSVIGSDVEANPSDPATDTLSTIGIDGTVYDIAGSGGGGNALILDAQIYSEDEQVVGVWTDGKPLYQKTFIDTVSLSSSGWTTTSNSITDCESLVKCETVRNGVSGQADGTILTSCEARLNDNIIEFFNPRNVSLTITEYTVWYTKTTDTAGSGGYQAYGFSPVIYSTEEREIGVWTDNKPLYEKTIYIGAMTRDSSWHPTAHGISNIEKVVEVYGQTKQSTDGRNYSIPHYRPSNQEGISAGADTTNVYYMNTWLEYASDTYITVRYTKTTDVAGSGSYNTLGVPTVHYTTDEQVIGTWVDGKPLYRKTVIKSGTISQRETVSLGIANVENIFLVSDASNVNNGQTPLHLVTGTDNSNNTGGFFDIQQSDTSFLFRIGSGMVGYVENAIITVQYTKTTD